MSTSPLPQTAADTTATVPLGFVYTVVERPRPGLCTTWLHQLARGDQVHVYPRVASHFHAPDRADASFVMVCAGSGIGPFLGFLEHRKLMGVKGGFAWLVFGCRNKGRDDLHVEKLLNFEQE